MVNLFGCYGMVKLTFEWTYATIDGREVTDTFDFRSKNKNNHIYLYFIVTRYLWNNALVEDIDN